MIHPDMSAAEYHSLAAISATTLIDCHQKCPAWAWAYSALNPRRLPGKTSREMDFGSVLHLAILERELLGSRIAIIDAKDFRSDKAKTLRDEAIAQGKTPILYRRRPEGSQTHGLEDVVRIAAALRSGPAAELLFGEGQSEVSYTWKENYQGLECKARADRIQANTIVDLKTATSASSAAFDAAVLAYGHHQRAAWYKDGWWVSGLPDPFTGRLNPSEGLRYVYVVIEKDPPHLVGIYECSERAESWGRRINNAMLAEIRHAFETGLWRGYEGGARELRDYATFQYAMLEEEGKL